MHIHSKKNINDFSPVGVDSGRYRPAQNPEYLICQPIFARLVNSIRSHVALPSRYFSVFYVEPLKKFLSLTEACYNNETADRLALVVNGLKLCRGYLLPRGVNADCIRDKKDLWTYAVFITLVTYDLLSILRPMSYYTVEQCGCQPRIWQPAVNILPRLPFVFQPLSKTEYSPQSNTLLLPQIFDQHCLNWLAQDGGALREVLESIVYPKTSSSIGPLIIKTFNLGEEGKFGENSRHTDGITGNPLYKTDDRISKQKEDSVTDGSKNKISARIIGQTFVEWLKSEQYEIIISANGRSLMFPVPQGIALVTPEIFKHYAASKELEWKTVQNGFLKLKLHQKLEGTHEHVHKLNRDDGSTVNVILLKSLPS